MAYTVNQTQDITPLTELPFHTLGEESAAMAPGDLDRFLSEPRIAVLSYIRKDGRPNQAPLWFDGRGGVLRFTVATGSAKHHALKRDPRVSVTIQDERPPYRAVIVDGVAEMRPLESDETLPYDMAVRYFGKLGAQEYWKMSAEGRERNGTTLITVVPSDVKGFDNTRTIGPVLLAFARLRNRLPIARSWL